MTTSRILAALFIASVAAGALSGCAVVDAVATHEREHVFATHGDAAAAEVELPSFVPDDSTNIRMRTTTSGPDELVRFTTAEPLASPDCEPGTLTDAPLLDTTWWPTTVPDDGMVCASWQVFERDGAHYAWVSA
jgi:hypothetical protein